MNSPTAAAKLSQATKRAKVSFAYAMVEDAFNPYRPNADHRLFVLLRAAVRGDRRRLSQTGSYNAARA